MRKTGPDIDTVMAVLHRDGYRCIRDGTPAEGDRGVDWVLHHRRPRAMGGTRRKDANSAANLLCLCTPCHLHVEANRAEARANGWLVPSTWEPWSTSVLVDRGSRWVYLTPFAQYVDAPGPGGAQ